MFGTDFQDKYTSAVYSVGVKVTYCILGFILLYGSMVTVPDILQPISDVLLILSVQITIFSLGKLFSIIPFLLTLIFISYYPQF